MLTGDGNGRDLANKEKEVDGRELVYKGKAIRMVSRQSEAAGMQQQQIGNSLEEEAEMGSAAPPTHTTHCGSVYKTYSIRQD